MSSHSMLSRFGSNMARFREDGEGEESWNDRSDVSIGMKSCWSARWLCSSSIRPRVRGSDADGVSARVRSRKASSWLSEASGEKPGLPTEPRAAGGASWICGGERDRAVFTGRVVMLAVTGWVLFSEPGGS